MLLTGLVFLITVAKISIRNNLTEGLFRLMAFWWGAPVCGQVTCSAEQEAQRKFRLNEGRHSLVRSVPPVTSFFQLSFAF